MFWSKGAPRDVRLEIENLVRELKTLKTLDAARERFIKRLGTVLALVNDAKADVSNEGERIKTLPWIDQKFDPAIDKLVENEVKRLERLNGEVANLASMAGGATQDEHMKMLAELIGSEAETLQAQDADTRKAIQDMERETLAKRLTVASVAPLGLQTKDGTRWSDVTRVVRQLGGWLVNTTGKHKQAAVFPGAPRPIPLSEDVRTEKLAKEMMDSLDHLGPRKRGSINVKKLQTALKAGDIHAAA